MKVNCEFKDRDGTVNININRICRPMLIDDKNKRYYDYNICINYKRDYKVIPEDKNKSLIEFELTQDQFNSLFNILKCIKNSLDWM